MTNLSKKNNIKQVKEVVKKTASLDKLAQLSFSAQKTTKKTLFKRAKSKHFTNVYVKKLASLKSPLQKSYNNTIYGCSEILVQKGNKLTSTYCNNRWCTTCNRIRTAKQIKGYTKPLNNLIEPMFVTLTIPNVKNDILKGTLKEMLRQFTNIRKNLHSKKIKLVGLRKLECTYNPIRHDYHPHFHLIIQKEHQAVAAMFFSNVLPFHRDGDARHLVVLKSLHQLNLAFLA
jgi:plasmid rolling circle replication initiator protein Rep